MDFVPNSKFMNLLQYEETKMVKAYIVAVYNEIHDPEKLKAYAIDARPVMEANGAQFLARGTNLVSKEGSTPLSDLVTDTIIIYRGNSYSLVKYG